MSVFFLFTMHLSKFTITTCCGCERTNLHISTEIQQKEKKRGGGVVWEHCHALLSQHYTTTIPAHTLAVKARGNHAHFRTRVRTDEHICYKPLTLASLI